MLGRLVLLALWAVAIPQVAAQTAPPRTIRDILALFEQHKPNAEPVERALKFLERPPPATENPTELIRHWTTRARAAAALGLAGEELEARRKARDIARGTGSYGQLLKDAAARECAYGAYAECVRNYEEIIRISNRAGPLQGAYGNLAVHYAALGDVHRARELFALSEAKYTEVLYALQSPGGGYPLWIHLHRSVLEGHRGTISASLGRLAEAEASLRLAFEENAKDAKVAEFRMSQVGPGAPPIESNHAAASGLRNQLAAVHRQQGRYAEAEWILREDLKLNLAGVGRQSGLTSRAVNGLGALYVELGRFSDAEALARLALEGFERSGLMPESGYVRATRGTLAAALIGQERWSDALRYSDGARRTPSLAIALLRVGRADQARAMTEHLVADADTRWGPRSYAAGEARGALAMALAKTGQREAARKNFEEGLTLMQGAPRQGDEESGGGLRRATFVWIVEGYLELLAELHLAGVADAAAESFRIADLARGQRVQQAVGAAAARSAAATPELAALVRKEQDLRNEVAALSSYLVQMLARPPERQLPTVMADMRSRIERIRAERGAAYREIEKRFPAYANLINPAPPAIGDAIRALRPGEALLSFYVAAESSYVWALSAEGRLAFARSSAGRREIGELVARILRSVHVGGSGEQALAPFDVQAAQRIFELLAKPIADAWAASRHLLVVAHGPLSQIPFALLATAPAETPDGAQPLFAEYRKVPWLVRKVALTHLPSVNVLVALRGLPASRAQRAFAGFGDPIFSKEQRGAGALPGTQVALRAAALVVRSVGATQQLDSARLAQLPRLPETREEILDLAAALGAGGGEDVFLAERANEKEVKGRDLSDRRVLAFATHGLVPGDIDGLEQPALALTAPEIAGAEGDGLLTMDEILALKLDADWVLLSACNTGAGETVAAEAISGLGRAFFFAGSRALLLSHWPVETVSARLLTTRTLGNHLKRPGTARAEALRQAMLEMIDSAEATGPDGKPAYAYAHPMFWSAFSLVGDGS